MVVAAFVAPFLLEATARFIRSAAELPGVRVAVITSTPADQLPPGLGELLAGHWRVDDALDPDQIVAAVMGLAGQLGPVERLVGRWSSCRSRWRWPGKGSGSTGWTRTAQRPRQGADEIGARAAGVPCARHQLVHHPFEAVAFAEEVGFPLVAKPPAGAGAQATFRLDEPSALQEWLRALPPARTPPPCSRNSWSARSTPSTASPSMARRCGHRSPTTSPTTGSPAQSVDPVGGDAARDIRGPEYAGIHEIGPAALKRSASRRPHAHGVVSSSGRVGRDPEVAARPPGAQLTSMHGYAHDMDPVLRLGRASSSASSNPDRAGTAGTVYARHGQGPSPRCPRPRSGAARAGRTHCRGPASAAGQPASSTYLGYVMVRHPDTDVVRERYAHRLHSPR